VRVDPPIHSMQKGNFLRFGKRAAEEWAKMAANMGHEGENQVQNVDRRDFREFVRFGKRSSLESEGKRRDDFLRFGKKYCLNEACKRSNDFLRFG